MKSFDRGRNTQKPVRNRSESVRAGLRAPPWALLAWLRSVWGPIWAPSRRSPDGFLKVFGALVARPSAVLFEPDFVVLVRWYVMLCNRRSGTIFDAGVASSFARRFLKLRCRRNGQGGDSTGFFEIGFRTGFGEVWIRKLVQTLSKTLSRKSGRVSYLSITWRYLTASSLPGVF